MSVTIGCELKKWLTVMHTSFSLASFASISKLVGISLGGKRYFDFIQHNSTYFDLI